MTDVDPIEGERFDRGRWPFPVLLRYVCKNCGFESATVAKPCPECGGSWKRIVRDAPPGEFLGPVPAGETVHGHATVDADRAGFQSERHALEQETAAEHIKNALQLLTGNGDEDRVHLLVLMDAARARLRQALEALDRGR